MGFKEDNEAGLRDAERLKHEASEVKKGANEKLREHNENAENGPDGAQALQPLPEDVDVEAHAEPLSKPQNTFKATGVDPEGGDPIPDGHFEVSTEEDEDADHEKENSKRKSPRRNKEEKATPNS